ncbi:MAG: Serine hydroxymethyltransferase [uncultured bacterium]|nr:MAG: Serine hydroxymethyltransferase [uncultured bacterium]
MEASQPNFRAYSKQIVKNSKALARELLKYDFDLVTGGSENHLILIDLRNKKVNGALAAIALEAGNIVVNKNGVPFDTLPPFYPSGIRLGTAAITTRGMKEKEMVKIAKWFDLVINAVSNYRLPEDKEERRNLMKKFRLEVLKNKPIQKTAKEVKDFTSGYPLP